MKLAAARGLQAPERFGIVVLGISVLLALGKLEASRRGIDEGQRLENGSVCRPGNIHVGQAARIALDLEANDCLAGIPAMALIFETIEFNPDTGSRSAIRGVIVPLEEIGEQSRSGVAAAEKDLDQQQGRKGG